MTPSAEEEEELAADEEAAVGTGMVTGLDGLSVTEYGDPRLRAGV